MPERKRVGRFHVITDTILQTRFTHAELAAMAIAGGADTIQYRSKSNDIRAMIAEASLVRDVCRAGGVTFLVNDRVDLALAVGADGVHLGRGDMPVELAREIVGDAMIVGATVRNREHLETAAHAGADYAGLGPVFGTASKDVGIAPLGLEVVRNVCAHPPIPVIAIAGITAANAHSIIAAGAYGIAVIGAVCCAPDVHVAAAEIAEVIRRKG